MHPCVYQKPGISTSFRADKQHNLCYTLFPRFMFVLLDLFFGPGQSEHFRRKSFKNLLLYCSDGISFPGVQ